MAKAVVMAAFLLFARAGRRKPDGDPGLTVSNRCPKDIIIAIRYNDCRGNWTTMSFASIRARGTKGACGLFGQFRLLRLRGKHSGQSDAVGRRPRGKSRGDDLSDEGEKTDSGSRTQPLSPRADMPPTSGQSSAGALG